MVERVEKSELAIRTAEIITEDRENELKAAAGNMHPFPPLSIFSKKETSIISGWTRFEAARKRLYAVRTPQNKWGIKI